MSLCQGFISAISAIWATATQCFCISEHMGAFIVRQRSEDKRRSALDAYDRWQVGQILSGLPVGDNPFEAGPKAQFVPADTIEPAQYEWIWPGRIPLGALTLFSGDPKLGKSLATLAAVAAVTRGTPLPDPTAAEPAPAPRGSAIILSAEDDPARTIRPRLRAAGAELDRVHILSSMIEAEFRGAPDDPMAGPVQIERLPTLSPEDLQAVEQYATALGDCRLIVFDPISAYVGAAANRESDLRRALAPLKQMAERLGVAILLVTHHNKRGASGTNGKYRVLGQIGYVGISRANFMFLPDPDDPSGRRRLMLNNGLNLSDQQPGLVYVIRDDGEGPYCDWLPETIDLDADAALARTAQVNRARTSSRGAHRRDCEEWLRGYLTGGPKPATECAQAAQEAGFNRSLLERARAALAIRCVRLGFGKGACYYLSLPEASGPPLEGLADGADDHAPQFFAMHVK
jgi:putative DNA primase/helicase